MRANILFSGSKGNCTYISDGETSILVDVGGCLKRIKESIELLGDTLDNVQGIFITHEHTDHIKAVYTIAKKYDLKIYTTIETARAICTPNKSIDYETCRTVAGQVMTISPEKTYEVGTMMVKTFATPHDAAGSLGFVFQSTKDKKSIGYATDIGYVTDGMKELFSGVKNIIIESNHDLEMLKNGIYPEYLKQRILSDRGHLSNTACSDFIKELAQKGSMSFTLAHLSEENNMPTIAKDEAERALKDFPDCRVRVASAYFATEVDIY